MWSLDYLFPSLAFSSFVHSTGSNISSEQCWHEYPLSKTNLQSSINGKYQLPNVLSTSTSGFEKHSERLSKHHPWSYPPICTGVLQTIGDKLCVYTNTSFSHNRGISIFTTPKIASSFTTLPPFQNPKVLDDANINDFSGTWYTSSLPGKGVGMLAKQPLGFKDRVTAYTPAFLAYLEGELSTMEREKFFRIAVDQLPQKTKEMYLGLATVYGIDQVKYQDVVKANTFQIGVEGVNHMAVFPETARLNHACAPNAQYFLDPELLTHFVHITRPVAKDEEITISYTSPLDLTATRQTHLAEGFHFTCTCPRCSTPESTDATFQLIQPMQDSLNDWSATSLGTPVLAEKLLGLYRIEGLEGFMDVPYGFAALAWNAVGDVEKARGYAEKAKEAILLKDGAWTANMKIWEEVLEDSKRHWSFNRRV